MIKTNRLLIKYIQVKFKIITFFSKKSAARQAFQLFCTPLHLHLPHLHATVKSPDSLKLELNGIMVNGYIWNRGQTKRVLILHGFSSSAMNFQHFVNPLTKKGFEIIAFDAPAHGMSGGKQINAVIYADLIKNIIDKYGPIKNFIAHSFGGLAVMLALEDITHDRSTKVVLLAPATETTTAITGAFRLLGLNNPIVRKEFDALIFQISGKQADWYSIKRALPNVNADILWIHDEDDTVTPLVDAKNALINNPPNVNFIMTKGLGHRQIYRDQEIIKEITSFL